MSEAQYLGFTEEAEDAARGDDLERELRPHSAAEHLGQQQFLPTATTHQDEPGAETHQDLIPDEQQEANQAQPQQWSPAQPRRPSFFPPLPVPVGKANAAPSTGSPAEARPLTSHELYERLAHRQQQQPLKNLVGAVAQSTLLRPKRQSLYATNRPQTRGKDLARQNSLIVGTPSFQERYGKLRAAIINRFVLVRFAAAAAPPPPAKAELSWRPPELSLSLAFDAASRV